ncbi:MAG: hypothetical protein R3F17_07540 [Planctomycetota bacterium]
MKRLISVALFALARPTAWAQDADSGSVFADVLYTSKGHALKNVMVTFVDGKITAITPGATAGEDTPRGAALTAGMIDLSARVTYSSTAVEQTNEVEASLSVAGALDLFDPEWLRMARTGTTTVLTTPPDRNVVGGLCAIVKTQGSTDIAKRQLKGRTFLRGAMGMRPRAATARPGARPTRSTTAVPPPAWVSNGSGARRSSMPLRPRTTRSWNSPAPTCSAPSCPAT